ncbi:hypothetical protein F5148DRAFT_1158267 [Russula earlei]|uniref:Uncharacterized protein n=1 Tax=Russula earlei TaxID=71964 RepID=A0ACC0UNA3_9AGAM|nr:hypothetical protein F5148DRAFT_1158267 [Russula earlei]
MPRVAAHFNHRENFTDVGNGKWLCNICKAEVMTVKQAVTHEGSAQHQSRAEAYGLHASSSAVRKLTSEILSNLRRAEQERSHWTDLSPNLVSFWRRGLAAAERGEEAESMHDFLDKMEEELANRRGDWSSSPVEDDGWGWGAPAEDWTPTPDVWASGWDNPVAEVPAKVQHVHHRGEGSSGITSMHREGSMFDGDEAHDDNDTTSFVENFLQRHAVDARRKERMRSFYEMPTDQKIRKIQEVIRDLRGQS